MLGKPSSVKPVAIWLSAGPCVFDFAVIEWMKHIRSARAPKRGSRSLVIVPLWPRGRNSHCGLTRLPCSPWNVIIFSPDTLSGSGVSWRRSSSGL